MNALDDLAWLARRTGLTLLDGRPPGSPDLSTVQAGVVVEPTHVTAAARLGVPVIAVVGWPTGRHHSVIKAAEARLAAESGAAEVWLAVDDAAEESALLADIIAVRQAVSAPTVFGVISTGDGASVFAAERSGADVLAVAAGTAVPGTRLPVAVYGAEGPAVETAVEALEEGAARVFVARFGA